MPPGTWFVPVKVPLAGEGDALAGLVPRPHATTGTDVALYLVPSGAMHHTSSLSSDVPPTSLGPVALRADFDAPSLADELVVAAPGTPHVWRLQPVVTPANMIVMLPTEIRVAANGVSDGRLLAVDADDDGDVDVLAGVLTSIGPAVARLRNEGGVLGDGELISDFDALGDSIALDVPAAPHPFPLALADFDRDNDLDAVSPDGVFERRDDGAFAPRYRRTTDSPWQEAVVADLDRDDRLDVVVASADGSLHVLRNRPTGFVRVAIVLAGPASRLRAGDFDGDGLGDVAFRERAGRERIRVLFGAIGAFAPPVAALGLPAISRLEVGRFRDSQNLDAVDDLVVVGFDGRRAGISLMIGAGDRRLGTPLVLPRGSQSDRPVGAVAGRFLGGDTYADLVSVAVDRDGHRRLWIFPGAPELGYRVDEAFTTRLLGPLATLAIHAVAAGDVDADGREELIVLGRDPNGATQLVIATLNGSDVPDMRAIDPGVGEPRDLAVADVDHDGRAEVFAAGTTGVVRLRGDELSPVIGTARSLCPAQLDDDSQLEVAVIADRQLLIVDGVTLGIQRTFATTATHVRNGDVDGDGVSDLVLGDGLHVTRMRSVPQVPR